MSESGETRSSVTVSAGGSENGNGGWFGAGKRRRLGNGSGNGNGNGRWSRDCNGRQFGNGNGSENGIGEWFGKCQSPATVTATVAVGSETVTATAVRKR